MFGFSKSKNKKTTTENETPVSPNKQGWLKRLGQGLKKTRNQLKSGLAQVILGKKTIDKDIVKQLETTLLLADVGIEATQEIIQNLSQQVARNQLNDPQALITELQQLLLNILKPCSIPLELTASPSVILMAGINGAGKTTSIAKLTHYYQQQGKRVMLAAGDTFRAAAIEQLQSWGEKNNAPVIAQHQGADSASVIYDAMQAATARQYDILIADTAGRLHTQHHLMDELKKIKRVIAKQDPSAPHETMLVLDASLGQNGLNQAQQFHDAINLTGISLTKLDGTAKGGILFAIAKKMGLPIRFIGVGEQIDDLKPFSADQFVESLFLDDTGE